MWNVRIWVVYWWGVEPPRKGDEEPLQNTLGRRPTERYVRYVAFTVICRMVSRHENGGPSPGTDRLTPINGTDMIACDITL